MPDTLIRTCVDCGDEIEVTISEDGTYVGGHYFGSIIHNPDNEPAEYWECDSCYEEPHDQEDRTDLKAPDGGKGCGGLHEKRRELKERNLGLEAKIREGISRRRKLTYTMLLRLEVPYLDTVETVAKVYDVPKGRVQSDISRMGAWIAIMDGYVRPRDKIQEPRWSRD